ncbi:hypothetical protein VA596_28505 [Amycolatopsis sp., V23-08]|uniref:Uncharacterized protein n=1 Tax=Amycolatopsis heterodermiae TaxID=3110235 RepID=A0ABU5RB76_9PSEU|nr:hypothetical protein [Amycolatopsis sp., V23-08]MEA5363503.1 hypothetical protein [Amycolatopsis sp., V23-08]
MAASASARWRRQAVHTIVRPITVPSPSTSRATYSVRWPHASHGVETGR